MCEDVFEEALTDLMQTMPQPDGKAVYTPSGGAAIEDVDVVINRSVALQPVGHDAEIWEQGTTIDCLKSQTLQTPGPGDTFATLAETFTVQAVLENDGVFCKVQVV
jgi:hypothetical protein